MDNTQTVIHIHDHRLTLSLSIYIHVLIHYGQNSGCRNTIQSYTIHCCRTCQLGIYFTIPLLTCVQLLLQRWTPCILWTFMKPPGGNVMHQPHSILWERTPSCLASRCFNIVLLLFRYMSTKPKFKTIYFRRWLKTFVNINCT